MLDTLRRYSQKWVTKVFLGLAVLIFVVGFAILSSLDPTKLKQSAIVVYVNEHPVTNKQLDLMYDRLYRRYRDELGEQLNENLLKQLNLKFQALSLLINRQVMKIEAERLGFLASDEEVRNKIASISIFHNDRGVFDPQIYLFVLSQQQPRITPQEFEEEQRDQVLLDKVEALTHNLIYISDAELVQDYILERKEVDIDYLLFSADALKNKISIPHEAIEQYYRHHPEEFTTGTRLKVRVVRFPLEQWAQGISVSEQELRDAYEKNKDQYRQNEEVRARHILLRLSPQATSAEEKRILEKIARLQEKLKKGAPFDELARKYSEDPGSKETGGDLGWFGRGRMIKEFEEAAFSTPPGEITGPVRTIYGYHLIYVHERRAEGLRSFEEVRMALERDLKLARARSRADEEVQRIRDELHRGRPFAEVVTGGVRIETEEIAQADPRTQLKYPPEILQRLFQGSPPIDRLGEIFRYGDRPYYIQVLEELPPIPRPFEQVAPIIHQKLLDDRAVARAAELAQQAARLLRTEPIHRVARKFGVEVMNTGPFNLRRQEVPGIGKIPEIMQAAFRLTPQNPAPPQSFRVGNNFYVIRYKSSHEPSPEEFQRERGERYTRLLNKKSDLLWQEWLTRAKQETAIKLENPPGDLLPPSGS